MLPVLPVGGLFEAIVRSFLGDNDVVDVTLAESRSADADESRLALQVFNRRTAAIAHARSQAADQLRDHVCKNPLMGDPPFNALRDKLRSFTLLGVAIARSFL